MVALFTPLLEELIEKGWAGGVLLFLCKRTKQLRQLLTRNVLDADCISFLLFKLMQATDSPPVKICRTILSERPRRHAEVRRTTGENGPAKRSINSLTPESGCNAFVCYSESCCCSDRSVSLPAIQYQGLSVGCKETDRFRSGAFELVALFHVSDDGFQLARHRGQFIDRIR